MSIAQFVVAVIEAMERHHDIRPEWIKPSHMTEIIVNWETLTEPSQDEAEALAYFLSCRRF